MERTARTRALPRLAAIDIGSNSIRLVVAEVQGDGTYRVLDEERDMARLGQGLVRTGRLGEGPMRATLAALAKMKAIADGFKADVRAVATSAVREATNGRAFRKEVERRLGIHMKIISSDEEALLAFRSATRHFDLEGKSVAVADIGGGSLEVVLAAGTVVDQVHSLPLGTVRVTEELCRSDPLRPRDWRFLRHEIDRIIKEQIGKPPFPIEVMIGSGGTFTTLAQMAKCERDDQLGPVQGYVLTQSDIGRLLERLRDSPPSSRSKIPGLNPKRADIIVAGVAAVARLAKRLGVRRVLVNERGVRDGILLAMIEERWPRPARTGPEKPKDRLDWVRLFARKCRSNERHCDQVARLAGKIFDGLQEAFELPLPAREILQAAALLHDVGYLINHSQHHKHAYHLIVHSDLSGFSAREVDLIANVVRYHRRALPKKSHASFAQLPKEDRRLVRSLSGILRIADGLDRTHSRCVTGLECRVSRGRITMLLDSAQPPQVEIWDAKRKADLFEKAFKHPLSIRWRVRAKKRAHRWAFSPERILRRRASKIARPSGFGTRAHKRAVTARNIALRPIARSRRVARGNPIQAPSGRIRRVETVRRVTARGGCCKTPARR